MTGPATRRASGSTTGDRAPFGARFALYLSERFPLPAFVPLITMFTFSSAAFSRLARGERGFIAWPLFAVGALTSLVFFFTLRVLDEHKDADTDRRFRPELPVPRGLVTLGELRWVNGALLAVSLALNAALAPVLLWAWLAVAAWAALMTREFFVRAWLRAHVGWYLVTHMMIMPMIDAYTTGLDWLRAGTHPPAGLLWFLAVTFLNGVVIEIGRKIRSPEAERIGVDTYTAAWGPRVAPAVWLLALAGSLACAVLAGGATGHARLTVLALVPAAALAALPAFAFLGAPRARRAPAIDVASGLWPLATYVVLGAAPFLARSQGVRV
jgi:4-hydroxybenzoate polyprenyltransferase